MYVVSITIVIDLQYYDTHLQYINLSFQYIDLITKLYHRFCIYPFF